MTSKHHLHHHYLRLLILFRACWKVTRRDYRSTKYILKEQHILVNLKLSLILYKMLPS